MSTIIPEVFQSFSIWGGGGFLIKTFHMNGAVPYWMCFSIINIIVRTALFPLVLYSAHTASKFGKVAAELQFFVSMFQNDYTRLKTTNADLSTRVAFLRMGLQSLRGVYKLHKVNPLAAFWSPLLQIPVFIYMSVDLRKLVNGRDPELAQELTDCGDSYLFWISDLTEADPFFALPIFAGAAMYANMEVALGRRSLAGTASSKADMSILLKDLFQSVAIFMPCFASHNPAGMQVYLCTSFIFTSVQSFALRNEQFRLMVGLPSLHKEPEIPKYGMAFVDMKKLEQKADEMRGDGEILGKGILAHGWRTSFPGTERESSIEITRSSSQREQVKDNDESYLHIVKFFRVDNSKDPLDLLDSSVPYVHGISASSDELAERKKQEIFEMMRQELLATKYFDSAAKGEQLTEQQLLQLMEKANRGEKPVPTEFVGDHGQTPQIVKKAVIRRPPRNRRRGNSAGKAPKRK